MPDLHLQQLLFQLELDLSCFLFSLESLEQPPAVATRPSRWLLRLPLWWKGDYLLQMQLD